MAGAALKASQIVSLWHQKAKDPTGFLFIGSCGCFSNQAYKTKTKSASGLLLSTSSYTATHAPHTLSSIDKVPYPPSALSWVELRPTLPNVLNQHPEGGFVLYTHAARQQRAAVVTLRSQLTQGWLLRGMVGPSLLRTHDVIAFASSEVMGLFVA
jgi:hypothetical protein